MSRVLTVSGATIVVQPKGPVVRVTIEADDDGNGCLVTLSPSDANALARALEAYYATAEHTDRELAMRVRNPSRLTASGGRVAHGESCTSRASRNGGGADPSGSARPEPAPKRDKGESLARRARIGGGL